MESNSISGFEPEAPLMTSISNPEAIPAESSNTQIASAASPSITILREHADRPIPRASNRYIERILVNPERNIVTLKVLVIGDPGVGKTAFINYFVGGKFQNNYRQTIGVDFFHKMIRMKTGHLVRLQLWDIAGQERQRRLFRVYYRDANGCLLLFDLSDPGTFSHVHEWKAELDRQCALPNGDHIPCILLGNKADLGPSEVYANQIDQVLRQSDFVGFRHVSAKEGTNVSDSVEYLSDLMIAKWRPSGYPSATKETYTPSESRSSDLPAVEYQCQLETAKTGKKSKSCCL